MIDLDVLAARVAELVSARGETIAVAEGSCGGRISAALLAVPGASLYFGGGAVVYTAAARRAFLDGTIAVPEGLRGATEGWAAYLAESVRRRVGTSWGVGEGGAAGPTGNRYGDPAGHAWVAVGGPTDDAVVARSVLTGSADRADNMVAFAAAALTLLIERLEAPAPQLASSS